MPVVTIQVDGQQEVKMFDLIRRRQDFRIDGGQVFDGEKIVFLKGITFQFAEMRHCNCGEYEGKVD